MDSHILEFQFHSDSELVFDFLEDRASNLSKNEVVISTYIITERGDKKLTGDLILPISDYIMDFEDVKLFDELTLVRCPDQEAAVYFMVSVKLVEDDFSQKW